MRINRSINGQDRYAELPDLKIVNTSRNRISDESDEEEILDRYIDQSFEDALSRSGERPPRKKSEIINYLERIALYHNQRRETTILSIPELKEGETKEELENLHQSILPWVNTHIQFLRKPQPGNMFN